MPLIFFPEMTSRAYRFFLFAFLLWAQSLLDMAWCLKMVTEVAWWLQKLLIVTWEFHRFQQSVEFSYARRSRIGEMDDCPAVGKYGIERSSNSGRRVGVF
jgi:hypothetical protein